MAVQDERGVPVLIAELLARGRRDPSEAPWGQLPRLLARAGSPGAAWDALADLAAAIRGASPWDAMAAVEAAAVVVAWCTARVGVPASRSALVAGLAARALAGMSAAGGDEEAYGRQLEALLVFSGRPADALLARYSTCDELDTLCPACGARVLVRYGAHSEYLTAAGTGKPAGPGDWLPLVRAADVSAAGPEAAGVQARLLADGYLFLAARLAWLCGLAACPACAAGWRVSYAISRTNGQRA